MLYVSSFDRTASRSNAACLSSRGTPPAPFRSNSLAGSERVVHEWASAALLARHLELDLQRSALSGGREGLLGPVEVEYRADQLVYPHLAPLQHLQGRRERAAAVAGQADFMNDDRREVQRGVAGVRALEDDRA